MSYISVRSNVTKRGQQKNVWDFQFYVLTGISNFLESKTVANGSMSFIDVRDCAAHHVNCMEKKLTGRFMSLKESWHWEDIINAVYKIVGRENDAPKFKGDRVKLTKFDDSRMKMLGVNEISN